jgi:DNA polymerase (family 10)
VTNAEAARALRELALFLEMDAVPFKPRAYEKAAAQIEALDVTLEEIYAKGGLGALEKVPGVGKAIARKMESLMRVGRIETLEKLRARTPVDVLALTAVEGVGPRSLRTLYDALGVRTVEDLREAARKGRVRTLPRFGEKSEQRILRGIGFMEEARGRRPIGTVLGLARVIEGRLGEAPGVEQVVAAGSLRRRKETIGDLDFLVVSDRPDAAMDRFAALPEVEEISGRGAHRGTAAHARLRAGLNADLRIVPRASLGAALIYFTGSKDHNVALRKRAIERGWKLSEYGLFEGERSLAGATEEEVYAALGLAFIAPELREDAGEIDAAREGALPRLIEAADLRGDVQTQTSWTDGADPIEAMAEAARALGRGYIAITDHTRDLAMTGGLDEARLLEQAAAIRALDRGARWGNGFRLLAGAEVNIRKDGTLDIADDALAQLDVVGASVHSHFDLPREEMTRRMVRAMENPHVDILFHPTCRRFDLSGLSGRGSGGPWHRVPVDVDLDALIAAALRTGTALELDAHPGRLDLKDEHVRKAVAAGAPLVVDSDAHSVAELRFPDEFGIGVARRGWARREDVLNTLPVEEFLARLKGGRKP